jgi:hypothetical protein
MKCVVVLCSKYPMSVESSDRFVMRHLWKRLHLITRLSCDRPISSSKASFSPCFLFKFQCPFFSLTSSSSCLRLLPRLCFTITHVHNKWLNYVYVYVLMYELWQFEQQKTYHVLCRLMNIRDSQNAIIIAVSVAVPISEVTRI